MCHYAAPSGWLEAESPRVLVPDCSLALFAEHPQIVTPIAATFDHKGRLLVVECHTHFPPENYAGPRVDRIRIMEDTNGDGRADRIRTFWEGSRATMSLRRGPFPWIYVATRMEIFRIADQDADDVAETVERLVELKTPGNYPHNGLCGLAFDQEGHLYFGLGENLGEPYTLVARDGTQCQGGGEGGNIYRMTIEGQSLEQIATGFWNPFGIHVDSYGRVWAVDNDPDASPPCRLHRVLPGGDYGYQFRFGRTGRHPLQAWNGELPGTMPMVAGTGEAPCAVLPLGGRLWVTSWGDNRIETYQLVPYGAWFRAIRQVVVQGDEHFRPVDFALSPNGELYFTDWVDKSYPVHGQGRVWRLVFKAPPAGAGSLSGEVTSSDLPPPTSEEALVLSWITAVRKGEPPRAEQLAPYFGSGDVALRQVAIWADLAYEKKLASWPAEADGAMKLARMQQARWLALSGQELPAEWLRLALQDADPQVRLFAVRLVAEFRQREFRDLLEATLNDRRLSPRLFQATLAALEWLDQGNVSLRGEPSYDEYALRVLNASDSSDELRAVALQMIDPDEPRLDVRRLESWAHARSPRLRREAVRTLALRTAEDTTAVLVRLAEQQQRDRQERADAIMGLEGRSEPYRDTLRKWASLPDRDPVGQAARQVLETHRLPDPGAQPPTDRQLEELLMRLPRSGDPDRGWRLFFSKNGARCASCHRLQGRGSSVGPDLTGIAATTTRLKLVQSIADPAREVAPLYTPWLVELEDGRILTGLSLPASTPGIERFLLSDGTVQVVPLAEIASRRAGTGSLMPSGYFYTLSLQDWSDLLALLGDESQGAE
ncbi:MAG: cytochrome c [Pirellulaceae bacterium]|nr:MAG: cytochrome c [Pirellulaceae bacterium]